MAKLQNICVTVFGDTDKINRAMKNYGLTNKQLCNKAKIGELQFKMIKSGKKFKTTMKTVKKVSETLGFIDFDDILKDFFYTYV